MEEDGLRVGEFQERLISNLSKSNLSASSSITSSDQKKFRESHATHFDFFLIAQIGINNAISGSFTQLGHVTTAPRVHW